MPYFLNELGFYYSARTRGFIGDIEVPMKPNEYCTWDGKNWIEDTAKKQADEAATAKELAKEALIEEELRTMAIDSLKAKGKWIE